MFWRRKRPTLLNRVGDVVPYIKLGEGWHRCRACGADLNVRVRNGDGEYEVLAHDLMACVSALTQRIEEMERARGARV